MCPVTFDFEQPIADLEDQIRAIEKQLQELGVAPGPLADSSRKPLMKTEVYDTPVESDETLRSFGAVSERERLARDIDRLKRKMNKTRKEIYANLTPWQRVQIARHLDRPHSLDYISMIFSEWNEVHGDRLFSDDPAMVTGYAFLDGQPVAIIGQQKGANTRENVQRNFGMSHPEGYRKALRIMKVANKFHRPIIIFVDTPGAYPGIGSEERGVAEAIARNMKEMFAIEVPIIICVIGEGASGGAIGIGVGDTILMMENAWYTVISPEGCASILWRDAKFAPQSAEALKLTAKDLLGLEVIDDIIPEPEGGAHQNRQQAADNVKAALLRHLKHLRKIPTDELLKGRFQKFRKMGKFIEG